MTETTTAPETPTDSSDQVVELDTFFGVGIKDGQVSVLLDDPPTQQLVRRYEPTLADIRRIVSDIAFELQAKFTAEQSMQAMAAAAVYAQQNMQSGDAPQS